METNHEQNLDPSNKPEIPAKIQGDQSLDGASFDSQERLTQLVDALTQYSSVKEFDEVTLPIVQDAIKEVSAASDVKSLPAEVQELIKRFSSDPKLNIQNHQQIGLEMELFVQVPFAPGSPILLPNGFITYSVLLQKMRALLSDVGGYQEVRAPVLLKQDLLKISGHMDKYQDSMFTFTDGDNHWALKPMNCPVHMEIFKMKLRSYRDLPIRYHDDSTLHRKENSGTLNCMARLQQFHQDDTHIFVRPDQLAHELRRLLGIIDRVYKSVDMDYSLRLSTRPEKYLGDPKIWEVAETTLKQQIESMGLPFTIDEGGGAFYGPKIDVDVVAANGKPWQVATSQLDFNLPERFDLSYIDSDGTKKRPVLIHSAIYGATERFFAMMVEHTQGKLPMWMAPEQARVLPISEKFAGYAEEVRTALTKQGLRVKIDESGNSLNAQIKAAQPMRVPYLLIIGGREAEQRTVSVRSRGSNKNDVMPLDMLVARMAAENDFNF